MWQPGNQRLSKAKAMHYFVLMSKIDEGDSDTSRRQSPLIEIRIGRLSIGMQGSPVVSILLVLLVIWGGGATYAALTNVAFATIGEAALFKAVAILGAFVLFGYLVVNNAKARQRERQLDSEFELERTLPPAKISVES